MPKPFRTYDELIDKLHDEKGLCIPDREKSISDLKQASYFALISGYKRLFKNKTIGKYQDGVTFDHIVSLYEFDEGLRIILLRYVLRFERNIKSLYSYHFAELHGENQAAFTDANNYNYIPKNQEEINKLVRKLYDACYMTQYKYIKHYRTKHCNVPIWVLVNTLTLGTISKMFMFSKNNLQARITKEFSLIREKQFASFLNVITKFRNVCAHNERLFDYKTKSTIPDLPIHGTLGIQKKGDTYVFGKNDLFSIVIALRCVLLPDLYSQLVVDIENEISVFNKKGNWLSSECLLHEMGFPQNWADISEI